MANWLISQQGVLCVSLIFMLLLERYWIKKLSANGVYFLWLCVPLALLLNNLPNEVLTISSSTFYQYVVVLGSQERPFSLSLNWLWAWAVGAGCIVYLAGRTYFQFRHRDLLDATNLNLPQFLPKSIKVYGSKGLSSPVLVGFLFPKLILPENFSSAFSLQQQNMILQHELTHYKRADNFFNLIALILLVLFWFNPLVWLAYSAFRQNQELACDEAVLKNKTHQEKVSYSKALLLCSEHKEGFLTFNLPYGEKHTMLKRITLIKNVTNKKPYLLALTTGLFVTMLTGVALAAVASKPSVENKSFMASPVFRVEPLYPPEAAEQNLEGMVVLQFDIAEDGSTSNVSVVKAQPAYTFDKNALAAVKQWKYKPRIIGGVPQKQTDVMVQLDFRLAE